MQIWPGSAYPLGATWDGSGTNFALFSEVAERVQLCLFDADGNQTPLDLTEVDGFVWHCYLPALHGLRDRFDETMVLSVWGTQGPMIVHVEESSQPIIMTMRVGAVLPVLQTASGLAFAAFPGTKPTSGWPQKSVPLLLAGSPSM